MGSLLSGWRVDKNTGASVNGNKSKLSNCSAFEWKKRGEGGNFYDWIRIVGTIRKKIAQLAGAVEYTNCYFAQGQDPTNKCPGYDTKQSDGEIPVMLELWGMQSTLSLTSLPGPLCPRVVAPDRILSMGQIVLNCLFMLNWIAWNRTVWLNWITWNRNVFDNQTVYLCWTKLFKMEQFICIKMDLALNNQLRLICHKPQTNKQ